jgi:glycosyltransferase involved in cell wall biosynthesis
VRGSPLVSVLTAVHNRADHVADAVESVLGQTHRRVEHVVVDDGSTDGTVAVLRELALADQRLRVLQQDHRGPSAARNRALAAARGELVAFLDSDDLIPRGRLERQLEYLDAHPEIDGIFGTEQLELTSGVEPPARARVRLAGPSYCWSTILLPREAVLRVGAFDEQLRLGEDTDLSFRLAAAGVRMAAVDEVFLIRRYPGDNLSYELPEHRQTLLDGVRHHLGRGPGAPR